MKILVTGANGFVGYYLVRQLLANNYSVLATGRGPCRIPFEGHEKFSYASMDLTDPSMVAAVVERSGPVVLVHAAAMSKPDDCEREQALAYRINVEGTRHLLQAAEKQEAHFVFVSTDFVFDGEKGMYSEEDEPRPVNYYGSTKWQAEELVKRYPCDGAIVRTILVYGKPLTGRGNLLSIIKDKLEKGEQYNVVDDQLRTPTYVEDLATGIVSVIPKRATGIFHLSGADMLTPYQMACKTAAHLGLDASLLKRVTAEDFKEPALRPPKTGFIIDKAKRELGYDPVGFAEGLAMTFPKD